MDRARINSSNSMAPSCRFAEIRIRYIIERHHVTVLTLFSSKTRKTREANLLGSPSGKNCL